jgi:hypothetical protein
MIPHLSPTRRLLVLLTATTLMALYIAGPPLAASPTAQVNVKLSGTMQPDGDVYALVFSPDSRRVVYMADAETDEAYELFSAPSDGGSPPVRLSGLLPFRTQIWQYQVTPDSAHVVYDAPQETAGVYELFIVPIDGGLSLKLNGPLPPGGGVSPSESAPTPPVWCTPLTSRRMRLSSSTACPSAAAR